MAACTFKGKDPRIMKTSSRWTQLGTSLVLVAMAASAFGAPPASAGGLRDTSALRQQVETPTDGPTPTPTEVPTEAPSPTDPTTPTDTPAPTDGPTATEAPAETPIPSETPTDTPVPSDTPAPTETTTLLATQISEALLAPNTWYVAPTGNDTNDCLSASTPCATINAAIAKASPGDVIYVAEGLYTGAGPEVVLITQGQTLSGGWDASFAGRTPPSTARGLAEESH